MADAYASLRIPVVRRYILGRWFAAAGRQMLGVAIGWQLYDKTDSLLALGMVGLVQVVPVVVLALPAGHIVDRKNRLDVSIIANIAAAVCALALALISFTDAPTWMVYPVLFAAGVAGAFESPANGSLMAQIVPPELFANANAWRASSFQLASTGGPAAAGFLIAAAKSATLVYVLAFLGGLIFVIALSTIPRPPTPPPARGAPAQEVRAGLKFVFGSPLLLAALTLDMFAVLLGGATALLPAFQKDVLHVGAEGLGWLRAAPSIGALVMAIVTTRLPPWKHPGRVLLVVVAGFGLATIGFGLSRVFWLSMACLVLTGVFDNVSVIIRITLEQMLTPNRLRGRVSAVHYVFIGLSNEMGEFESGTTGALLGPVGAVVMGGIGTCLVVGVVAWKWPELRDLGPLHELRAEDPDG